MNGGEPRDGRGAGNRTPTVDRRRYLRAIGAVGAAGALGAGATGSGAGQEGDGPAAPHGLRVEELGTDSVTLAWYHRAGYDGETTAASYEVRVDGAVVREVDAPAPPAIEWDPLVTATVENLEPGTEYEVAVRAVDPNGATATASLATTTRDPSRIGEYEFEATPSETVLPTNWADVTTEDAAHRVLRIRGGMVPGGACRVGTVHELAYDEEADALRVVVDAPRDGGPPCPPEVRELAYDFRVTLDRTPQTVVVQHRDADWRREVPVLGRSPDRIPSVESERDETTVDSEIELTVSLDDGAVPDDVVDGLDGFRLELAVEDPTVAELTGIDSEITDLNDEDVWIADDGSRLRWEAPAVPNRAPTRLIRTLATASLAGDAVGETAVTAAVDLHTDAIDRTMGKSLLRGPLRVVGPDYPLEYGGVFPVERGERSLTVGWEGFLEAGTEYEIAVDGATESVVPAEETELVRPEDASGEYRGATVDGLDPDTSYRIDVDKIGPDGERVSVGHGSVRTLNGTVVRNTEFQVVEQALGNASEWGTISVGGDRTRVEVAGGFWFPSVPQTLYLEDVTYEADGLLRLSVAPTPGGGSEAVQELDFELGVDLERPVDRVVLEYPTRNWKRLWDATLGGDYERFELETADDAIQRGERTELSLTMDPVRPDVGYRCRILVDDRSVTSFVDVTRPDWSDGRDPDGDDRVDMSVDVEPADLDATGRVDVGTIVVEGAKPGSTSFRYLVRERVRDEGPTDLGGRSHSELTVEDGPAGPPAIGEGDRPRDPDDDGLYEDVNGDGTTNLADAGDLFRHRQDDAIRNHVEHYDFSGNDEVDLADVVDLFRENTD